MRKLIRTIVFVALGVLILQITENILEKKWNYMGDDEDFSRTYNQFYRLEDDVLQAVFLGKSSVKWSVSPTLHYKENSYVTYNLASNYQPIAVSYYLLKEIFKNQSPEVVFCDISALFENVNMDYTWHMALDNMPMCMDKIKAAFTYAQIAHTEKKDDERNYQSLATDFLSMISPLYCYHSRWDSLEKSDFLKPENPEYDFLAGYYMTAVVSGTNLTSEKVNSEVNILRTQKGFKKEYLEGNYVEQKMEEELYCVEWEQTAIEYIDRMKKLCEDHGTILVMIKIPTMYMPQDWYGSWSIDKYDMTKALCDEMGVPFLDMVYDKEHLVEINWQQDTLDNGMHLNTRGAKKVTKTFGMYLEEMGLEKKISDIYWNFLRDYERMDRICMLQSECNFDEYFNSVSTDGNYTIIVSAQNDFQASLSEENIQVLSRIGFQSNFAEGIRDSFVGVIREGKVEYEALSNRKIEYEDFLPGGGKIEIISSGYNTGSYSSIIIGGKEHSMNRTGLNIVVYDNDMHLVVDSVNFNTQYPGTTGYRDPGMTRSYLTQYKAAIVSNGK